MRKSLKWDYTLQQPRLSINFRGYAYDFITLEEAVYGVTKEKRSRDGRRVPTKACPPVPAPLPRKPPGAPAAATAAPATRRHGPPGSHRGGQRRGGRSGCSEAHPRTRVAVVSEVPPASREPGEGRPAGGGTWAPHSIRTAFPTMPALATPALFCTAKSRVNSSSACKGGACRSYELQLQIEEQHQRDVFLSKPYLIPSAFTPNITHLVTVSPSAALPSKMKNKKVPFPSPRKVASFDRLYPPRNRT